MVAIILFFVLYIVRIIFFRFARKKDVDIDQSITTPKDYTLWISNLPLDTKPSEVAKAFESYQGCSTKIKVQKITYAYNIGEYIEVSTKNKAIRAEILGLGNIKGEKETKRNTELQLELGKNEAILEGIKSKFRAEDLSQVFTGQCFVSYKMQIHSEEILDKWKLSFF